jgi:hypothetical protein
MYPPRFEYIAPTTLVGQFADCLRTQLAPSTDSTPAPTPPAANPVSGVQLFLGALRRRLARIVTRRNQ